jgi:hypothetical protein
MPLAAIRAELLGKKASAKAEKFFEKAIAAAVSGAGPATRASSSSSSSSSSFASDKPFKSGLPVARGPGRPVGAKNGSGGRWPFSRQSDPGLLLSRLKARKVGASSSSSSGPDLVRVKDLAQVPVSTSSNGKPVEMFRVSDKKVVHVFPVGKLVQPLFRVRTHTLELPTPATGLVVLTDRHALPAAPLPLPLRRT